MSEPLREAYLLADLDAAELDLVNQVAGVKTFQKKDLIVKEGTVLTHLYIIKSGSVSLTVTMDSGDEMLAADEEIIGRLHEGECFGEFSLLDNQPASANVHADETTEVYEIPREELTRLIEENHGICRKVLLAMLKTLVGRLRKTDKDLVMTRYFERMR